MSREPTVGEHDRGSEGEKTLERFVQHLLQHHHLVVLLLPHLVEMKEDDKTVLGVELDETHLVAEVLDDHPGLGLLRLASQGICSQLWRPSLEEEMSEGDIS